MKLLLRALLVLALVFAVVYASSPWWIPPILARQLPAGWQLKTLKMSWPGLSGINVKQLQVDGQFAGLKVTLEADNSRLSYRGLATQVDTVALHIYLASEQDKPAEPLSIDDLSLPMLQLNADLPTLSINQTRLALHLAGDGGTGKSGDNASQPIIVDMQGFNLKPTDQGHYQLDTIATIAGQKDISGRIQVAMNPEKLAAFARFPADNNLPAWLDMEFVQRNNPAKAGSELKLQFDADASGGQWLDALLSRSSQNRVTHLSGQLQAEAAFNGDLSRPFSRMTLHANQFQVDFDGESVLLNVDLQAQRDNNNIKLAFDDRGGTGTGVDVDVSTGVDARTGTGADADTEANATSILLLDRNGQIETLLGNAIPELKRSVETAAGSIAIAELVFSPQSHLTLTHLDDSLSELSIVFNGGLGLSYSTDIASVQLEMENLTADIAELKKIEQLDLNADVALNWQERKAFSYANDTLNVAADSLTMQVAGKLDLEAERISFQPLGSMDARLPGLKANIQTGDASAPAWIEFVADDVHASKAKLEFEITGPPDKSKISYRFNGPLNAKMPKITIFSSDNPPETIVTASEMDLVGSLISDEAQFESSGNGYLGNAKVMPMAASASRLDLNWTNLSLANLTGALDARTDGFKIDIEEESWTDFDLDASLELLENDDIKGGGKLTFGGNATFPIEFSGNTESGWWDLKLLENTVPLASMRSLMRTAKIELPSELKLAGGSIDVTGLIQVRDEISANLDISGTDIAANLAQSGAQKVSFQFDSGYTSDMFASGPVAIGHLDLAGGIGITDISADLNLQNSHTFDLSNLSAELFDGQLRIDQLSYANTEIEDTTIGLTHINMQKLLTFLDIDGLQGSGFIDFSLPASSHGGAIRITDGSFNSTGPGRLAYSKGDMANANIGLQALDNFHYKDLSGKIAYDSTGPYTITVHLEGSNPDLYDGYPLVFNLTINGSLPELFEAMFMTGSFEESILEQINMKNNP